LFARYSLSALKKFAVAYGILAAFILALVIPTKLVLIAAKFLWHLIPANAL
jgi:hypothetical protein